jgi:hypothetical protein
MAIECQLPLKEARSVVLSQIDPIADAHNAQIAARERISCHRDQFRIRTRLRHYRDRTLASARHQVVHDTASMPAAPFISSIFNPSVVKQFSARESLPISSAISYNPTTSQVAVASSDKSITFYSSSLDRRHRLQFHLDGGFYMATLPSCLGMTNSNGECILIGDSHGGISIASGSQQNLQIRHAIGHGEECVRKVYCR